MLYFRVGESDDAWFSVCNESPLTSRATQVTLPLFPPRQATRSVILYKAQFIETFEQTPSVVACIDLDYWLVARFQQYND